MSSMSYDMEFAAAKRAASLAFRLCQKVQKTLLQSDVLSKSNRSPVTVADFASQALVSLVLERELSSEPFSLVAEKDSGDLRKDSGKETRDRVRELVNETLASDASCNAGGVVTDAAGAPLDFSKGRYLDLDTGIIVTNQKLMPLLLKAVRESLEEKASAL